ncbi:histone H1-like [Mobula hypostoma]|uniref:histone H1-like n=1 Tax=Mobula hypostoma TaxID=723540 RepID=UPI002FC2CBA6
MTETAEVAPPAAPATTPKAAKKKKAAVRTKSAGPKLGDQIDKIVADCRSQRGVSVAAIKKSLASSGVDVQKLKGQIRLTIKRKLDKGTLVHTKGAGASGSLRAAKKEHTGKVVKKAKKPATKAPKTKKAVTKKSVARKTGAKKSPAKTKGVKKTAVKKAAAKKTATKKTAQKPKSPKKVAAPKVAKKSAKPKPKAKSVKAKTAAKKTRRSYHYPVQVPTSVGLRINFEGSICNY